MRFTLKLLLFASLAYLINQPLKISAAGEPEAEVEVDLSDNKFEKNPNKEFTQDTQPAPENISQPNQIARKESPTPHPSEPELIRKNAIQLAASGDVEGGRILIETALKKYPDDPELQKISKLVGPRYQTGLTEKNLAAKVQPLMDWRAGPGGSQSPAIESSIVSFGNSPGANILAQQPASLKQPLDQRKMGLVNTAFERLQVGDYEKAEEGFTLNLQQHPRNWLSYRLRALTREAM